MRYYWGMTAPEAVLWVIGTVLCIMCFALYWVALRTNSLTLLYLALVPGLPGAICHLTVFTLRIMRWLTR